MKCICYSGLQNKCFVFRMCILIKREHYPEYEMLSGHTILFLPPLTVLNLLPTDVEFKTGNATHAISSGKQAQITDVSFRHVFRNQEPLISAFYTKKVGFICLECIS